MSLSRFHPFAFPFDDFFGTPTFYFPRDLMTAPRNSNNNNNNNGSHSIHANSQYWRHPGYEVNEDDKNYMVSVDVPGVKPEDMTIKVEENTLRLSGGRKVKTDKEVSERRFDYRLSLGDDVDLEKIAANLENGVLHLTAPKKVVKKPEARTIQITSGPAPKHLEVDKGSNGGSK